MPTVKNVGEPCAREPHARFEVAAGGNQTSRASPRRAVGRLSPTLLRKRKETVSTHLENVEGTFAAGIDRDRLTTQPEPTGRPQSWMLFDRNQSPD